jgi:hypothetical protein
MELRARPAHVGSLPCPLALARLPSRAAIRARIGSSEWMGKRVGLHFLNRHRCSLLLLPQLPQLHCLGFHMAGDEVVSLGAWRLAAGLGRWSPLAVSSAPPLLSCPRDLAQQPAAQAPTQVYRARFTSKGGLVQGWGVGVGGVRSSFVAGNWQCIGKTLRVRKAFSLRRAWGSGSGLRAPRTGVRDNNNKQQATTDNSTTNKQHNIQQRTRTEAVSGTGLCAV